MSSCFNFLAGTSSNNFIPFLGYAAVDFSVIKIPWLLSFVFLLPFILDFGTFFFFCRTCSFLGHLVHLEFSKLVAFFYRAADLA